MPLPYHRGVLGGRHSRVVVCLVPALLFTALYLRALDYGYVWTDIAEFQAGTILRPPGRLLAAFPSRCNGWTIIASATSSSPTTGRCRR